MYGPSCILDCSALAAESYGFMLPNRSLPLPPPSLPCGLAGSVGCSEPAGRDAHGKPHRSLFRCTEIGDSFDNFMYSSVVLGNTLIGDTDGAAVGNCVSQVYNTINRVLTFVDEEGFECLPPVGIETAEEVLQLL